MTLSCQRCGGAVEMIASNGETDPSTTRTEGYRCVECDASGHMTLHPNDEADKRGCLR